MTKPIPNRVRDAAARAAAWLRANPSKHLVGQLAAQHRYGVNLSPISPHATCFCAVGRLDRELGFATGYEELSKIIGEDRVARIWTNNDCDRLYGLDALDRLAKGEEP